MLSAPRGFSPGAPTYREVRLLYENDRRGVDQDHAGNDPRRMAEWIYLLHPPRGNFAATMTDEERAAFAATPSGSGACWPTGC